MKTKVKVVQAPELDPVPVEVIAQSIRKIAESAKEILESGLTPEALVVLIKHKTGCHSYQIKQILDILPQLEKIYCVKPKKK